MECDTDSIVIENLKADVLRSMEHDDDDDMKEVFEAALRMLKYYLTTDQYDQFNKDHIHPKICEHQYKTLEVTEVEDHDDGSAVVSFQADQQSIDHLIEQGVNFMLIKEMLEGTTDQISVWAKRGKLEYEFDDVIDVYKKYGVMQ